MSFYLICNPIINVILTVHNQDMTSDMYTDHDEDFLTTVSNKDFRMQSMFVRDLYSDNEFRPADPNSAHRKIVRRKCLRWSRRESKLEVVSTWYLCGPAQ